jgi:S1-C subfamily serine protease
MAIDLERTEREALDAYSQVVTRVAECLLPSVASLRVTRRNGVRTDFGGGSGVVITNDGFLLTSAHVVDRSEGGIASFSDGQELRFEVIGRDALSDLAVVRTQGGDLAAAQLGDAEELRVGQLVVAVGNPLGFAGSVSAGVVSALGRSLVTGSRSSARLVENVIQTDAALHPGNSGGALADGSARVVGINTAVVGPYVGQGLGLAVPIDAATRRIIGALMSDGRVRRAYIGIAGAARRLPPVAGRERGVEVSQVVEGSPAAAAGVRRGDVVVELDGTPIQDVAGIQRLMTSDNIGRSMRVTVLRSWEPVTVTITPGELAQ